MKKIALLSFVLALQACVTKPSLTDEAAPTATVETSISTEKVSPKASPKGSLVDYALQIRPDHRSRDYSIIEPENTSGYALASGPYDGWKLEFFLFRAEGKDLVIMQTSGPEGYAEDERPYGLKFESYRFENKRKQKIALSEVMPLKEINRYFSLQSQRLKNDEAYKDKNYVFKYLKLPEKNTIVELKICSLDRQDEDGKYIALGVEGSCLHIGNLKWDKTNFKFNLDKTATLQPSTEVLEKYN